MITKLKLTNFKNFRQAEVALGPFSVLVGANAVGKSNIRDALRFLHGVARGYNLAEIIGGKYGGGGQLEWNGIRGGTSEICFHGEQEFTLGVAFEQRIGVDSQPSKFYYEISVHCGSNGSAPRMMAELFRLDGQPDFVVQEKQYIGNQGQPFFAMPLDCLPHPIDSPFPQGSAILETIDILQSLRFLDFSPKQLRTPSVAGQVVLSDGGETLSSVLHAMCERPDMKDALSHWIQELTPMDVVGFEFMHDAEGKILVYLVEEGGKRTSATSASDGTLRFLGILAALLGPWPTPFCFLEEIDTGIHPARLALLMDLIADTARRKGIQVVATTHSPQVLRLIRAEDLPNAALVYRVKGASEGRIKQLPDIPNLMDAIKEQDIARLHESAWMENVMEFTEGKPEPFPLEAEGR
jgi:predicted ATPase